MERIKDEQQYNAVMARIDELLFSADDDRLEELDRLSTLVEEYEQAHSPIV